MKDKSKDFLKLMSLDYLENDYIPERKRQQKFIQDQLKSVTDIIIAAEEELLDRKTKP